VRIADNLPGCLDYTAEAIVQRGSNSTDRVSARAATGILAWTFTQACWKPRASVEYNYASGDPTARDFNRNTFDQFYPGNHSYYGMIDQFGWKNMRNFRAGFDFVTARKLKTRTNHNQFDLATVQDSLYNWSGFHRTQPQGHQRARRVRDQYGRALPVEQDLEARRRHRPSLCRRLPQTVEVRVGIHVSLRDVCRNVLNSCGSEE
jgi:hypothetical protein